MNIIDKICIMCISALIVVVYSRYPCKNSISLRFYKTCILKRFISCNSDNSVETVLIIGNTYILWQNHVLNMFLR